MEFLLITRKTYFIVNVYCKLYSIYFLYAIRIFISINININLDKTVYILVHLFVFGIIKFYSIFNLYDMIDIHF